MAKKGQSMFFPPYEDIYVGEAGKKGRGVFASSGIGKNMLIEVAPLLIAEIPPGEEGYFDHVLYEWRKNKYALALGYGSLYNHAIKPNVDYLLTTRGGQPSISIFSLKKIKAREEITINYNGDPKDKTPWEF